MSNTPNNSIPYVPEGTLDPAAGLNDALDVIDALLQTAVIQMDLTAPPGSPVDGDLYIVAAGGSGAWAGLDNYLVRYRDEGAFWQSYVPGVQAKIVLNLDDGQLYAFDQTTSPGTWAAVSGGGGGGIDEQEVLEIMSRWQMKESNVETNAIANRGYTYVSMTAGASSTLAPGSSLAGSMIYRYDDSPTGSANRRAGFYSTQATEAIYRDITGNANGGGFLHFQRFVLRSHEATMRIFCGLANAPPFGITDSPGTLTNLIGVGCDDADTNLFVIHNDGSGSATKVDLGVAASTFEGAVLDLYLYAAVGSSDVEYRLVNLDTGDEYTGTISTDMPAADLALFPTQWVNTGSQTNLVSVGYSRVRSWTPV